MSTTKKTLETVFEQARHLSLIDKVRLTQRLMASIEYEVATGELRAKARKKNDDVVTRELSALTHKIIGCAMRVHSAHGPGCREDTYQRDLEVHFANAGLLYTPQKKLEVYDSRNGNKLIGYYIPDFIVAERVVVEIKTLRGLDNSHIAQVIGYLAVSACPVGLLINFGERSLRWRRILPPKKIHPHTINRQWLFVPNWLKE